MRRLTSVGSVSPSPRRAFRPLVRQRISGLLDSAYQYPVTVLIAGAGYGKSVALEHWLAGKQETVIRYNVREGTHGIFDFTLGLAQALSSCTSVAAKNASSAVVAAEKAGCPEMDLALWFENALRKFSGIIVLDDLHVAAADDPKVAAMLAQVIDRTLQRIRWVVASRSACGLPITSWIAYGKSQMALGERDLAFTHEEAATASSDFGAALSEPQFNELYNYTGGWPTALTFALHSTQRTLDLEQLRASTRDLTYEFLAEQVLRDLDTGQVDLLLRTAVYKSVTLNILTAAGFNEPRRSLQLLKDFGPFIISEPDGSVRYHDLFRDFLRNEIAKDDGKFRSAWTCAGDTYRALNMFGESLEAYLTASELTSCSEILAKHGFELIERGKRRIVSRALEALEQQPGRMSGSASLLALRAHNEANAGSFARAENWYRQAIEFSKDGPEKAELSLRYVAELTQVYRTDGIILLENALQHDLDDRLRASLLGTLAISYWAADRFDDALQSIEHALDLALRSGAADPDPVLLHQSAVLLFWSGKTAASRERAIEALAVAKRQEKHSIVARIHSLLINICLLEEKPAEALWSSKQMERSARDSGDMMLLFSALCSIYDLETERGNIDAVTKMSEELRKFDADRYLRASSALLPAFALQAAWQQRFDEACSILADSAQQQSTSARRALRAAEIALYAAAAGNRGRAETAAEFSVRELRKETAGEPVSPRRLVSTLLYLAMSHLLVGKASTANKLISEAEKIPGAATSERLRSFIAAIRAMYVHTETRLGDEELSECFATLDRSGLGGISRMLQSLPIPKEGRANAALLTKSELAVLRALERSGDSKAAAAQLGKSPHTVDWHVKAIMKKLGVVGRHEAIVFARDRGLL